MGYRVVTRRLSTAATAVPRNAKTVEKKVNGLFPTHHLREEDAEIVAEEPLPFTETELWKAASSLQNRKAHGPDETPAEVVKAVARSNAQLPLNAYNSCLKTGTFPNRWKIQRLVLLSKEKGDPSSPSAYRPLCMLDTAGKLLEMLLKIRLKAGGRRPI